MMNSLSVCLLQHTVSQKVNLLCRQITDPRLTLVHRQLQLRHHRPHLGQSLIRTDATAANEVIGVVHDVRFLALLVPEFLPSQHEPSHVQIAEQRTDHAPYTKGNLGLLAASRRFETDPKESGCCDE